MCLSPSTLGICPNSACCGKPVPVCLSLAFSTTGSFEGFVHRHWRLGGAFFASSSSLTFISSGVRWTFPTPQMRSNHSDKLRLNELVDLANPNNVCFGLWRMGTYEYVGEPIVAVFLNWTTKGQSIQGKTKPRQPVVLSKYTLSTATRSFRLPKVGP